MAVAKTMLEASVKEHGLVSVAGATGKVGSVQESMAPFGTSRGHLPSHIAAGAGRRVQLCWSEAGKAEALEGADVGGISRC